MKEIYSEFWKGFIKVKVIKNIHDVPNTAKYKYTDYEQKLEIYAEMKNLQYVYYGLII